MFVAGRGRRLLSCDYNQVELRVLAHVAHEDVLREIFASGEDVHAETAAEVLTIEREEVGPAERSKAKMVNYGIAYGLSAWGLADRLQISREEAAVYIARYFDRFPAVKAFIDETIAGAEKRGYVTTLMGRRRNIPSCAPPQRRLLGERLAVNTVIQGTAADIIKVAMVRSHRALAEAGLEIELVLQIHDELLFEGPTAEIEAAAGIAEREMIDAFELDPPLAVDTGVGTDCRRRSEVARDPYGPRVLALEADRPGGGPVRPTREEPTRRTSERNRTDSYSNRDQLRRDAAPVGGVLLQRRERRRRPRRRSGPARGEA